MPEGYKRSWGSVSKNFSPSRGFTSETKRMSKEAEDVYNKAMAQLKTKQEVYNLQTAQAKVTAQTDASTSKYEMAALSNFSKSLNNFLSTTVVDYAKEQEKKDLDKWREKWKTHDADVIAERNKIKENIAAISDNAAEVSRLEESLKKLKLFNELDPTQMTGNEQFAYYAQKADNLVKNSEIGFFNFKEEQKDNYIPATWKPQIKNKDTDKLEYQQIRVGDITDPKGHQAVKEMYLNKVLDDNPMGGLKPQLRTHLLTDPLDTKLEGVVDKNWQSYAKDIIVNKGNANLQALDNRLQGVNGYEDISLVASELDAVLTFNGNNASTMGHHDGRAGVIAGLETRMYTTLINNTRTIADLNKVSENIKYTLTKAIIKNGPNKGKTLIEAHPGAFKDDPDLTRFTKKVAARAKLIATEEADTEVGSFTISINQGIDKISADHIARQEQGMSEAESAVIAEKEKDQLFKDANKGAKTTEGKEYIFSMMGDTRLLFTKKQWMDHAKDLAEKWNGVIPEQELIRMPDSVREELKKFDIRIEENVPGGANEAEVKLTGANVKYLQNQVKGVEKTLTGNTLGNADSGVMADLANDWYHKRLQYYMLIADPPHSHNVAAQLAREEVSGMITSGGQGQEFVTEGPMKGMKNPFWAQHPSTTNSNNPWEANEATDAHRQSGLRLLSLPERHYRRIDQAVSNASDNPGGLDLKNNWIFATLNTEALTNGDLRGIEHLGIQIDNTEKSAQNHIVMEALTKLGLRATGANAADFVAKQRNAAIMATGGLKSPLLQNEQIINAWYGGDPRAIKDRLLKEQKARVRDRSVNNLLSGWG